MRFSLSIILVFTIGVLLGLSQQIPIAVLHDKISFFVLCGLMFFVGVSIGNNKRILKQIKNTPKAMLYLPLVTIFGTYLGVLFLKLFLRDISLFDLLAVGSGFGYYSLSSVLIDEYRGAELASIALLANIVREVLALVLASFFVRYFGELAPISAGGATTADTTLPIIIRSSGEKYAVVSIYHGFILDFLVPFLVVLFVAG